MNVWENDKGFTLIEILVSITILSVVLVVFASFFTQSALFTKKNEKEIVALNLARLALEELRQNPQSFSNNEMVFEQFNMEGKPFVSAVKGDGTFQQYDQYRLRLIVTPVSDMNTYQVKVQILTNDGVTLTETYGLIEVSP